MLIISSLLYIVERSRKVELVNPRPRLKAWLQIHFLNFAYIGIIHMPLIFFLVRWFNPTIFGKYLPVEHFPPIYLFNLMLFILIPIVAIIIYISILNQLPTECKSEIGGTKNSISESLMDCVNSCWSKHNFGQDIFSDDCFLVTVYSNVYDNEKAR
jgi:hypothetical protein